MPKIELVPESLYSSCRPVCFSFAPSSSLLLVCTTATLEAWLTERRRGGREKDLQNSEVSSRYSAPPPKAKLSEAVAEKSGIGKNVEKQERCDYISNNSSSCCEESSGEIGKEGSFLNCFEFETDVCFD